MEIKTNMWTVEVSSMETIKPSTPTPHHPCAQKLSWLDQVSSPAGHIAFVLFYPHSDHNPLPALKTSLSEMLTIFYPLAGRLNNDGTGVDCGDQGIHLIQARADANAPLAHLVANSPNPDDQDSLNALLPCSRSCSRDITGPLLAFQITTFASCGGFSIGCCFSHKIADGHSAATFLDAWAATARGRGIIGAPDVVPCPNFDAASYFVQPSVDDETWYNTDWLSALGLSLDLEARVVTKRFIFDESAIDKLRRTSPASLTRFQTVTALLWRCFIRARDIQISTEKYAKKDCKRRHTIAGIVVDMRGRALPENLFGNLCCIAAATDYEACDEGAKLRSEQKVIDAIKKIDMERLKSYQGVDGWSLILEALGDVKNEWEGLDTDGNDDDVGLIFFTSWTRFPFYETDFGWGKPVWVGLAGQPMKNEIVLMGRPAAAGGGIEAWLTLDEKEMKGFELDQEIIASCQRNC